MLKSEQNSTLASYLKILKHTQSVGPEVKTNFTYAIDISLITRPNGPTPILKIFKMDGDTRHRTDYQQASLQIDIDHIVKSAVKFWCVLSYFHLQANFELSGLFMRFGPNLQIDAQTLVVTSQKPACQNISRILDDPINWSEISSTILMKYDKCLPESIRQVLQQNSRVRHVIAHFDIDVDGVYVPHGSSYHKYQMTVMDAINRISLLDDMLIGSHSRQARQQLKQISRQYYIYTARHIDSLEDAQQLLSSSIRKMVLKYPQKKELIAKIPTSRLIIEIDVATKNIEQMLHQLTSWTECTCLMLKLDSLSYEQNINLLLKVVERVPKQFSRIFVQMDVSNIEQVRRLWMVQRVIPVLGKCLLSIANLLPQVISQMPHYQRGFVSCIIINENGLVCGHRTMSKQQIYNLCCTRVMGDCRIKKMSLSCDGKCLMMVIEAVAKYCEKFGKPSCFNNQSCIKTNLSIINQHIKGKINSRSYSGVMQSNPGLALAKVMEQFWEIICADSMEQEVIECSDFLVHFLMYINGKGVSLETIVNILNERAHTPQLISKSSKVLKDKNVVSLGILNDKYFKSTDNFILEELGIRLLRSKVPRKLLIEHEIVDIEKYKKYFGTKEVSFLPMKSKDMPWVIAFGAIDGCITYSPVMDNYPKVSTCVHKRIVNGLKISLIKKKEQIINTNEWSSKNKAIIACQHVNYVYQFLKRQGIADNAFTLTRIVGSSQSYLITKTKVNFILCDAVVQTGLTLEANNLQEWKTIIEDGQIYVGLFLSLNWNE